MAKASWMKASRILPGQCDGCIRRQPTKTPSKRGFSLGMTGRSLSAAAAMGPAEEAWRAAANHDDRRPLDNHDGSVRTAAAIGAAMETGAAATGDPNDIRTGRCGKRGRRHGGVCGAKAHQRACKQRGCQNRLHVWLLCSAAQERPWTMTWLTRFGQVLVESLPAAFSRSAVRRRISGGS